MILGGGHLVSFDGALGLGVNPSACNGQVRMDTTTGGPQPFTLAVGDYIVLAFSGLGTFYGVISQTGSSARDPSSGTAHTFTMLDNRIRLQWQQVYGVWNMEDEMMAKRLSRPTAPEAPGDSSDPGADDVLIGGSLEGAASVEAAPGLSEPVDTGAVRRRFWSILPQHWASRIRTWHDEPFSAREILNFAFAGAWGDFGFIRSYHSALSSLELFGLDHSTGITLGNLISSINEKAGLDIHITGSRTLVWVRKGQGLLPLPDATSTDRETGQSLASTGTGVRVIGDRVRVQVANVELEPDWKPGWQAFIDELAWRREVASVFELPVETKADQANLSAKAREVTVYQYAKAKNDPAFLDYRMFDRVSRNSMSAWDYIQNLVFRSYRIPPTRKLYGIPLSSLELADTLLVGTDINGEGDEAVQDYVSNPVEFYPPVQAQVIHKGQPLDFLRARDIRLFYLNARDLREEWTVATDFEVDAVNFSIRFAAPVFIDGQASENQSLYLRLNRGEGGGADLTELVSEDSNLLDVVVPNPAATIAPARVKASFCFLLGHTHRDFGTGPRRETLSVPGISLHLLDTRGTGSFNVPGVDDLDPADLPVPDTDGAVFKEVLYDDGGRAHVKLAAAAASFISQSALQATGGFTRHGVVATVPSGVVDRVSVRISTAGVTETISFTKAAATGAPLAERTLQRIQRTTEAYRGQDETREEIRRLRLIAAAEKTSRSPERSPSHRRFADVFSKPVGSEVQNSVTLYDKNSVAPTRAGVKKWLAGDIVWVDGSGTPVATGGSFGGVLVATPPMIGEGEGETQPKDLFVANKGIVPVRIRGGLRTGGRVWAKPGENFGGEKGGVSIGSLMHGEPVPVVEGNAAAEVMAMVSLQSVPEGDGRYLVSFDYAAQRLYVSEGSYGRINVFNPGKVVPGFPLLNDEPISDPRWWEIAPDGMENPPENSEPVVPGQEYEVLVVFGDGEATMELRGVESGSEEEEDEDEQSLCVATITFKMVGEKLAVDEFEQLWESDILWPEEDSSSSSSESDSSEESSSESSSSESSEDSSDDSGGSESEKSSNAIVRMPWHDEGYGALATRESDEVLLDFNYRDVPLTGAVTVIPVDRRHLFLCVKDSIRVFGSPCGKRSGLSVGVEISGKHIILRASRWPWLRPASVDLQLTGIRRGFGRWKMPPRTYEQYRQADAWNRSAYRREKGQL